MIEWLIEWSSEWVSWFDWLIEWLSNWLSDWLNYWFICLFNYLLIVNKISVYLFLNLILYILIDFKSAMKKVKLWGEKLTINNSESESILYFWVCDVFWKAGFSSVCEDISKAYSCFKFLTVRPTFLEADVKWLQCWEKSWY